MINLPNRPALPGAVSLAMPTQPFRSAVTASLAPLRAIFAEFFKGNSDIRIGFVGDSKDAGSGSGSGTINFQDAIRYCPAAYAAAEFAQRGFATSLGASYSDANVTSHGISRAAYDPRWSPLGADWAVRTDSTPAGRVYQALATGARITFTPAEVFDTITITLNRGALSANYLIDVDGGPQQLLVPAGSIATGLVRATISVPRGTHTIGIQPTGNVVFWTGIEVSDSTVATIRMIPMGASAWRASRTALPAQEISWSETSKTNSPLPALLRIKPDIVLCTLGTNDELQGVPLEGSSGATAFLPAMREIIEAVRGAGIFPILVTPDTFDPARCPIATQEAYRQAILGLGASYATAVPVIDLAGLGSYAARAAAGDFYDGLHLLRQGSAKRGQFIARQLLDWVSD